MNQAVDIPNPADNNAHKEGEPVSDYWRPGQYKPSRRVLGNYTLLVWGDLAYAVD